MKQLMIAMMFLLPCCGQETRLSFSGEISGTLTGDDGSAIFGGYVSLHLLSPYPKGRLTQTEWTQVSGPGGSVRFRGLSDGKYRLCTQVPQSAWLNPCEWGMQPPIVTISANQTLSNVTIVLKKGAVVPVRVDDPGQLLTQHEGKTRGAHLLMGIGNDASSFVAAVVVSKDPNGRDHQIVIPFNTAVKIVVYSSFFQLSDAAGMPLPKMTATIPVLVPRGQQPTTIRLSVIGGALP